MVKYLILILLLLATAHSNGQFSTEVIRKVDEFTGNAWLQTGTIALTDLSTGLDTYVFLSGGQKSSIFVLNLIVCRQNPFFVSEDDFIYLKLENGEVLKGVFMVQGKNEIDPGNGLICCPIMFGFSDDSFVSLSKNYLSKIRIETTSYNFDFEILSITAKKRAMEIAANLLSASEN